jgi:HD-like signal output (HDOD) protein
LPGSAPRWRAKEIAIFADPCTYAQRHRKIESSGFPLRLERCRRMLAIGLLAASILGMGAWIVYRRSKANPLAFCAVPASGAAPVRAEPPTPERPSVDTAALQLANRLSAERLWKLAFTAPSQAHCPSAVTARVRTNIEALLLVDTLNPNYFPRRPTLLPQLLQVVNDPSAQSEKLSRMIAHDPVLTADVLRMANSSLYRISPAPIETIQRAIVVCGVDALRGMLAAAMLRPVFRATRKNFPRLPRMLWERTERAARAAELYAMEANPHDRFEAQLVVLLSALGPLVVYGAAVDVYARNTHFPPNGALCVELIGALAPQMSQRIAQGWNTSPRLVAALCKTRRKRP